MWLDNVFSGVKEISPPALNLRRLLPETTANEPILVIISPGADPSQELLDLVRTTVTHQNYHEVGIMTFIARFFFFINGLTR